MCAYTGVTVDHSKALDAPRWTEVVKAVLKRQAGVAFAPKDLRSSFITFLLSTAEKGEATLADKSSSSKQEGGSSSGRHAGPT